MCGSILDGTVPVLHTVSKNKMHTEMDAVPGMGSISLRFLIDSTAAAWAQTHGTRVNKTFLSYRALIYFVYVVLFFRVIRTVTCINETPSSSGCFALSRLLKYMNAILLQISRESLTFASKKTHKLHYMINFDLTNKH